LKPELLSYPPHVKGRILDAGGSRGHPHAAAGELGQPRCELLVRHVVTGADVVDGVMSPDCYVDQASDRIVHVNVVATRVERHAEGGLALRHDLAEDLREEAFHTEATPTVDGR
jgi:hypothetical protein